MLQTARAAVLEAPGVLSIREYPLPKIGPDEMLLKTELAGVDGSDAKIYRGTIGRVMGIEVPTPVVMGDEILGRVQEVGERFAKVHGVTTGSRVVIEPRISCNECGMCLSGNHTFCKGIRGYGWIRSDSPPHLWGSYAEYVYAPMNARVHPVPEEMPAEAALLAAVTIADAIHWVQNIGGVRVGDDVVIIGPGPQGIATAMVARERGAGTVIVAGLTKDRARLAFAREMGADHTVDVQKEDLVGRVRELTGGGMADVVLEQAGSVESIQAALDLVRPRGTIVHMSMTGMKEVPLVTQKISSRELSLKGGLGPAGNVAPSLRFVASVAARKRYPLERFITHKFPLDESEKALRTMGFELEGVDPIKVAIDPTA